jgi:hypothetical protein
MLFDGRRFDVFNGHVKGITPFTGVQNTFKLISFTGSRPMPCEETCGIQLGGSVTLESALMLRHGSVLFAPDHELSVETPYGTINMSAGSVVLAVALPNGLAVYDLHDNGSQDVSITHNDGVTCLGPGRHVLISEGSISSYEEINPLGCIGHRRMESRDLPSGTRQYCSSFSIVSAINGLKALSHMRGTGVAHYDRLINTLLKDAAVIQTAHPADGAYQRYGTPKSYASAML